MSHSGDGRGRESSGPAGRLKDLLWGFGAALSLVVVETALEAVFGGTPPEDIRVRRQEYRRELRAYLIGFGLALALTLVPYGLVYWSALPQLGLLLAIGGFAIVQGVVHLRCFLHINPPRQNVDDLHLVLFTSVILFLMVGGTIWILADLAARMH